jgi:hypothetical protein
MYAKEGSLTGGWTKEFTGTTQMSVASDPTSGPLIGMVSTAGLAYAKQGGLSGPWTVENTGITQEAVAG